MMNAVKQLDAFGYSTYWVAVFLKEFLCEVGEIVWNKQKIMRKWKSIVF